VSKGCSFIRNRSSPWRGRTCSATSLNCRQASLVSDP
jgi:hypothetical protein